VTIGAPCRSAIAFVFDHHIEGAVFAAMAAKNAFGGRTVSPETDPRHPQLRRERRKGKRQMNARIVGRAKGGRIISGNEIFTK
jgi:hypothetical protein